MQGLSLLCSHAPESETQIVLAKTNDKTKETRSIMCCDKRVYASHNEAKHFGSVFALHRVNFDKVCRLSSSSKIDLT